MPRSFLRVSHFVLAVGAVAGLSPVVAAAAHDGHHEHDSGSAWWHTEACCAHFPVYEPEGKVRAAYDEASGRALLNYPPHRFADHIHMRLAVDIVDMNSPRLEATQTLTLKPMGMPLPEVVLDCGPRESMEIRDVKLGSKATADGVARSVTFVHEGEELRVTIDPAVPVGEQFELITTYTLTNPPEGITWTPETPAWPGRPAQLHTQGQPESNHYWFPCHDFPNERLTTEIVATVPNGFSVVSNGRLVGRRDADAGRQTFHWLQDKEHVNYLVTMVVGKFDVVDVGNSKLSMPVYAPPGTGKLVEQTYGRTMAMTRAFERIIDEPYPWDKYAQVVVHNFGAGGMENTSATSMYDTAILDRTSLMDGDLDGLIAHELAHQWFGDLITCNSWEHLWLNEGFATYFSQIWREEREGLNGYYAGIYGNMRSVSDNDQADAPYQPAMNSKEYTHPWEAFRRKANPYPKGSSILHMLRAQVGDDLFVKSLRTYVDRVKGTNVETDDLRYAFEDVTGLSFQRFFQQWCQRPGVPHVDVTMEWDSSSSQLKVNLKQTQNIDGYNPAFFFTMPIWVATRGGPREGQWLSVKMDSRETSQSFDLPGEPTTVAVNANLAVLAKLNIMQSEQRWLSQLEDAPTLAARLQAIDALRSMSQGETKPSPRAGDELAKIIKNSQAFVSLRQAAAEALFDVGGADAVLRAMRSMPEDARVRTSLLGRAADAYRALATRGDATPARLMDDLRSLAKRDESYGVRSTAIRQLGSIGGGEVRQVIVDSLDVPSQHDQIRNAAISALADMDEAASLPLVIKYTRAGFPSRTRPEAVQAVGRLAHHDPAAATEALSALVNDPERRTARAAGEALVRIGGQKATQALEDAAGRAQGAMAKSFTQQWLKRVQATEEQATGKSE